jgi:GTP pyrophosphokinase
VPKSIEALSKKLSIYSEEEQALILKAAGKSEKYHEGQLRESGEPYFIHPLGVARILIDLKMDSSSVVAALLHDVLEDTELSRTELQQQFGKEVESLVYGVTKIAHVKAKNRSQQEAETIRKMLFAMVKDIRVILIKLADKLHNMRTLEHKKSISRKREIATECLEIYAPLAGRLGISWMKDELEDISLKHLHQEIYNQIKTTVSQRKEERSEYLIEVKGEIYKAAKIEGIEVNVEARAKHFYSIYQKMKRRNKKLDEIYDFLGIRILCSNINECYTLLGLIHRLWLPIEGRFKDYIAMPKANRYQSLHTTVMCYDGKLLEVQIRTHEMHQTAEFGIAAHWIYKEGISARDMKKSDLSIINRVKNLNRLRMRSAEFLDEIKQEILKDSIYVFTPKGDVIQLPRGATPIDFAYHIHTEVGHHCSGAKADGSIIPLKEELTNTQVVEILTSPHAHPHLNWLRYVRTSSARSKIRTWLNKHDENLFIDRSIVAKKKTAAEAGNKEIKPEEEVKEEKSPQTSIMDISKVGVKIGNERNMMIRFARCCNPITGDDIIGYISRGRGIIVHKANCKNLNFINDFSERSIEVEWETVSPRATKRLRVTAKSTTDLFSEIEGAIRKYKGHLIEGRIEDAVNGKIQAHFTVELESKNDLKRVMKSIRTVPAVLNIHEIVTERT